MKNSIVFIYTLSDPRTNKVRYVGMSKNPEKRFKSHIKESKSGSKNHRCNWVRELLDENLYPIINIIEETSFEKKRRARNVLDKILRKRKFS